MIEFMCVGVARGGRFPSRASALRIVVEFVDQFFVTFFFFFFVFFRSTSIVRRATGQIVVREHLQELLTRVLLILRGRARGFLLLLLLFVLLFLQQTAPELRPRVLKPHLQHAFAELRLLRKNLQSFGVGIVVLGEERLHDAQLMVFERRSIAFRSLLRVGSRRSVEQTRLTIREIRSTEKT